MSAVFRYGDHAICLDGREIHLDNMGADLLAVLAKNHGRVVTSETLMATLWPINADEPEDPDNVMRQHLFKLRHKLEGTGLVLESVKGVGVRLMGEFTTDWSVR